MASIGGEACDFVRGRPPESYGPFTVVAVKIAIQATVETWIDSLEALGARLEAWQVPGEDGYGIRSLDGRTPQLSTIVVDDGTSFSNCVIGSEEDRGVRVVRNDGCINAGVASHIAEVEVSGFRTT